MAGSWIRFLKSSGASQMDKIKIKKSKETHLEVVTM